MAFWDGLIKNVQNFFGGGNNQKKKKDDEEQQRQRAVSSSAPTLNVTGQPNQPKNPLQVKQPTDMFGTLNNTGINKTNPLALPQNKPAPVKKTKQQELDELTKQNMDAALKQTHQGRDFWGAASDFFTGNDKKIAEQNARNKAVTQYQDKHGWNADPEVLDYIGNTRKLGEKTSKEIRTQGDNLNKFSKGMDKAAQVIQYVPVAGSVFNLGMAGNQKLAESRGTDLMGNSKDTAREMRNKVDFGMTNAEYDALDQETKNKLETVRNIGLALTPLDFTGLGGLAKSEGVALAKKGAIQLAKEGAIDAATKQGLKVAAKGALKSSIPATIAGTGVSAAAQGYLTGGVDPLEALKGGLMTGGTSMLIPNGNRVKVPGSRLSPEQQNLVNSTMLNMADKSTVNVDMPQTRAKSVPVTINNTERPLITDMTSNPGLQPKPVAQIRDVAGDTPGINKVQLPTAADRFANQPAARPDRTVEGIVPGRAEMPKAEPEMYDNLKKPTVAPQPTSDPNRNWKLSNQVDEGYRVFDDTKKLISQKMDEFTKLNNGKPFTPAQKKELQPLLKQMEDGLNLAKKANTELYSASPAPKVEAPTPTHRTWQQLMDTTEKPLTDYKVGDKVTTDTMYGQVTGKITKVPNFSEDFRIKGNGFKIKLDEPLKLPNGRKSPDTITADGRHFSTEGKAMSIDSPTTAPSTPASQKTQIQVKQVRSIPVDEMGSMPDPVRQAEASTPQAAPNKVQVTLDPQTQAVLDNPRKFNKQQVAAARNQRKLANQMAKTKEQTAEAIGRIDAASPEAQTGQGFAPTGVFDKGKNGNVYQKVNRATEMQTAIQETANLAPADVLRTARESAAQNGGGFNRRDIRNIAALFETKRLERGTPEWQEARQILKEDGTNWGQTGALRNYTMRRNASADELISRFESKIYRLADDPSKIDGALFDQVDAAETAFVETRDAAMQAYNRFTEAPTSANAKAYHAAQDAADKADRTAKQVEFTVAQKALKGNKDVQQARELEKMAQQADMYQMDAVDASMLSGTGTFVRNFVNASVGNLEEGLLGKISSRIASKVTGENVGGGGFVKGFKQGAMNVVDASKARAGAAGKNPLEHIKNWATTGNQLGDSVIDSQVSRNVGDHYTQLLKDHGYKGSELKNRASVMARQDPDNITETYQAAARTAAGLGSGITRNNKIETTVKNIISDAISGGKPNTLSENTAKLVTRMTLGFPTAIGRSVAEGAKRFSLGAPTFIKAMRTSDPQQKAILIKEGIKQAGSGGLVIPSLFYGIGASGAITGAYPEDQAERDRWQREGITENSIKIGNDYYQLPAYLGSWAIPALFYAGLGRNNGDFAAAAADMKTVIPSLLPTDQITNITDVINGRSDLGKFMSQTGASAIRAATPAGALLNELGKMIDPTQNETNDGTVLENLVSKVINGIPIANLSLGDKTDSEGNPLANPDPLALALGASSTEQQAGIEKSAELDAQTNSVLGSMNEYGAFSDPNLKSIITDSKTKKIYSDIVAGKQVNPEDLKKVQEAMTKGVSEKGTDTAYLEREQYDTNLTALRIKRELMAADPTQKPSDLKNMDVAIKRGEIYRDNEIPYDLIDAYQNTSVTEWRNMGDPESDDYDPDRYQQLWAIDEMMTKEGVSYAKGKLDKQKYSAKGAGKGSRGGAGSKMSTDFGTLKAPLGAPSVQQYETIDQRNGGVPIIQVQRPNIVHKIGVSG